MSFHNPTNTKRVEKIMDILELISKSGNSNGADREDFQQLLEPVISEMSQLSPGHFDGNPKTVIETEQPAPKPQSSSQSTRTPMWSDIRQMTEEAPLKELTQAMAIFMNRFDEYMHERKK